MDFGSIVFTPFLFSIRSLVRPLVAIPSIYAYALPKQERMATLGHEGMNMALSLLSSALYVILGNNHVIFVYFDFPC